MNLPDLTGKKVLIADDCDVSRWHLQFVFKKLNARVMVAGNGLEAVKLAKKKSFDLIFMDIKMPEMDGLEAVEKIRNLKHSTTIDVPIIGMTGFGHEEAISCSSCFNEYLNKPLNQKALYQVLTKYFGSPGSGGQEADIKKDMQDSGDLHQTDTFLDREAIIQDYKGHVHVWKDLALSLLSDMLENLSRIKGLIQSEDCDSIAFVAHKMKGGASIFRMPKLRHECHRLEQASKDRNMQNMLVIAQEISSHIEELESHVWNFHDS